MKTESPFTVLKKWFLDSEDIELPDEIKSLNIRSILSMFSSNSKITPYLNEYFNNYELYKLDIEEFCRFLKTDIVQPLNFKWDDFVYMKCSTVNKDKRDLHSKFPLLKDYEIDFLIEEINKSNDKESLLEYIGLLDHKSKRITKAELKSLKESTDNKIITFDDWIKNFRQ